MTKCTMLALLFLISLLSDTIAVYAEIYVQVEPSNHSAVVEFQPVDGVQKYELDLFFEKESNPYESIQIGPESVVGQQIRVTFDSLKAGREYKIVVSYLGHSGAGTVFFFTDCEEWNLQCVTHSEGDHDFQGCFGRNDMCDGVTSCKNGEDEKMDVNGKCVHNLPTRGSTAEGPCTFEYNHAVKMNLELPDCEENGDYSPLTCNTERCYCLDTKTGKILEYKTGKVTPSFYLRCLSLTGRTRSEWGDSQRVIWPPLPAGMQYLIPPPPPK